MSVKVYRPASVLQLLLIAFSFVALPLIFALVAAIMSVDRLAKQSQQTVVEAAQIVDSGRMLAEQVTAMERSARQFQLLGDPSLFDDFLTWRTQFVESVKNLAELDLDASLRAKLDNLMEEENAVYQTLKSAKPDSKVAGRAVARFPTLNELSRNILSQSNKSIGVAIEEMRHDAAGIQRQLIWQASALIPIALGLAVLGTLYIASSIRQIEAAIRRLGRGKFSSSIVVKGPQDLEELGERLDWLRLRLLDLDEQKTRFLGHVSHELKTPLTTIRQSAELMGDEVVGPLNKKQAEITQILHKSCLDLQKCIEEVLSFTFIARAPPLALAWQTVQLDELVEEVAADQKVSLQAKELSIEKNLCPIRIDGDREKLRVTLTNLLSNAIKFSPHGASIQMSLMKNDSNVKMEICDQGPGIHSDESEKIFDPFYQGRTTCSKGHIKGTGLGLAIAQEYVKAHNGVIDVANENRVGACFSVTLPMTKIDNEVDREPHPA